MWQWAEENINLDTPNHEVALAYQSLALVYLHLASNAGRDDLLPDTIQFYHGALALHPKNDPNRVQIMNNLAAAYLMQHNTSTSNENSLEEAIRWAQGALLLRPRGHPRRWESLLALNVYLSEAYAMDRDQKIGTIMLENYRELYSVMPQGHQARPEALDKFGEFVLSQEVPRPSVAQIQEAIIAQREALAACDLGTSDHQRRASNLASGLDTLFQKRPDLFIIDEAIKLYEDVLSDLPREHVMRRDLLNNLANSYNRQFQHTHDLDTMQATLRVRREVLAADPSHPQRDFTHHSLGVALCNRYRRLGNRRDLEDAIHHLREALYLRPRGSSHWHTETVYNLALALLLNYKLIEDPSSLESSVTFFRMAYEDRSTSHAEYLDTISFFASALMVLSEKEGKEDALHEAIEICVRARRMVKDAQLSSKSRLLVTLGKALIQDYKTTLENITLNEAIVVLTEAEKFLSEGRDLVLEQLISALRLRFAIWNEQEDIYAIIRHTNSYREELKSISANDKLHAYLTLTTFQSLVKAEDFHDTDSLLTAGLRLLDQKPLDYPGRDLICAVLASDLLNKDLKSFDFIRATELMKQIIHVYPNSSRMAFDALLNLLQLANHILEEHDSNPEGWGRALLSTYVATIRFLPKVAYLGLEQRELLLSTRTQNMSSAAVSNALKLGEVKLAFELMEQSRAIFWQQSMRLRSKPSAFAGVPAVLADELQQILGHLAEKISSADEYIDSLTWPAWTRDSLTDSRRLSERAEDILEEIRSIPGLERFLIGPSFDEIRQLSMENYVVVLVFHEHVCQSHETMCEAIALAPGVPEPIRIPLSEVSYQLLIEVSACLEGANANYRSALEGGDSDRAMKMFAPSQRGPVRIAHKVLRDLWLSVVQPILVSLGLQVCILRRR